MNRGGAAGQGLAAGAARALARLGTAAGNSLQASQLVRALARDLPHEQGALLERLRDAGEDHGLRLRTETGSVEDAARALLPGEPRLTLHEGPAGPEWILLLGRRGGSVEFLRLDFPRTASDAGSTLGGSAPEVPAEGVPDPLPEYAEELLPEPEPRHAPLRELASQLGLDRDAPLTWLVALSAEPHAAAVDAGHGLTPLRRLLRMLRPDRGDILAVLAFSVAIGVLLLITPVVVQALVNFVAYGGALQPVLVLAVLLLLGLTLAGALTALESWVVEVLQRRIFVRTLADLAGRLPRVTQAAHDGHHGPELVNRFLDVLTLQKAGAHLLLDGVGLALSVGVGLLVLAFYHPLLLAFDVVLLLVINLVVFAPAGKGTRSAIAESDAKYRVQAWLEELARSPRAFRSGGTRRWVHERSDELAREWVTSRGSHFRVLFGQVLGTLGLQALASTALLALGGLLVIRGDLTLGQLVAAELIVTIVVGSVAKTGKHLEAYYDLLAATKKVGKLLDLPVERSGGEPLPAAPPEGTPALQVGRMTFAPGGGDALLRDLSLTLAPGRHRAVLGASGSGKTALLELLWGLHAPQRGRLEVHGVDLRDLSLESLRRGVALVGRTEVLEASLRENVSLGRPGVEDSDVRQALLRVGLRERVAQLPAGLDTPLRPDGRPLSDGEVRRLVLARALVGAPRVLLVDGLLDPLDEGSRRSLLDVLLAEDAPWTLLLTTARPELAAAVGDVLELADGSLREAPQEAGV